MDFLHLLTKLGILNREVQIGEVYEDSWPGIVHVCKIVM